MPDDERRQDVRVLVERGLDFGGIHVRPAGEDQVGAPVAEVDVAVLVHPAHVAERLPSVELVRALRRCSGTSGDMPSKGRM